MEANHYVDGFVLAVPADKKDAYIEQSKQFLRIMKRYGVLSYVECWEDDVPDGEVTSFPMAVKREPGEKIVFSWMTWPSKEVRDEAYEKSMEDPDMNHDPSTFAWDGKRMIYGGFTPIVIE
ncbi:MAG: DUF1428 domain-containing protein [Pseudomonadota bacterium]